MISAVIIFNVPFLFDILRVEGGLSHRDQLWKAAIRMILEKPLIGFGPNSFGTYSHSHMDPSAARDLFGNADITAHNILLWRGAELGLFAPIIILGFWIKIVACFLKNEKMMRGTNFYWLYLSYGAIFISLAIKFTFEGAGFIFTLLVSAIILKLPRLQDESGCSRCKT